MAYINGKHYADTSMIFKNVLFSYRLAGWSEEDIRKEFELILGEVLLNEKEI